VASANLLRRDLCGGSTSPENRRTAGNRHQRLEIALFLGQVALDTDPRQNPADYSKAGELQALPETFVGWAIGPVNVSDLEKMGLIKAEFYSALPAVRALCERALLENWEVDRYLLSGIAAADGLIGIASLLNHGCDGQFTCASCGWGVGATSSSGSVSGLRSLRTLRVGLRMKTRVERFQGWRALAGRRLHDAHHGRQRPRLPRRGVACPREAGAEPGGGPAASTFRRKLRLLQMRRAGSDASPVVIAGAPRLGFVRAANRTRPL
jgi:hypothetical protein